MDLVKALAGASQMMQFIFTGKCLPLYHKPSFSNLFISSTVSHKNSKSLGFDFPHVIATGNTSLGFRLVLQRTGQRQVFQLLNSGRPSMLSFNSKTCILSVISTEYFCMWFCNIFSTPKWKYSIPDFF